MQFRGVCAFGFFWIDTAEQLTLGACGVRKDTASLKLNHLPQHQSSSRLPQPGFYTVPYFGHMSHIGHIHARANSRRSCVNVLIPPNVGPRKHQHTSRSEKFHSVLEYIYIYIYVHRHVQFLGSATTRAIVTSHRTASGRFVSPFHQRRAWHPIARQSKISGRCVLLF